jgi:hypothetical protein
MASARDERGGQRLESLGTQHLLSCSCALLAAKTICPQSAPMPNVCLKKSFFERNERGNKRARGRPLENPFCGFCLPSWKSSVCGLLNRPSMSVGRGLANKLDEEPCKGCVVELTLLPTTMRAGKISVHVKTVFCTHTSCVKAC